MSARPPRHATSPRAAAHVAQPCHGSFPPSAVPARPMSAAGSTPVRPKRPLSASRVQLTAGTPPTTLRPRTASPAMLLASSSSPSSTGVGALASPRRRPASASRVRATYTTSTLTRRADDESEDDDVDTIAIPVARIHHDQPVAMEDPGEAPTHTGSASGSEDASTEWTWQGHGEPIPMDRAAMAEAEAFLVAWQHEEASFRSPLLFAEASFAQAKAMAARGWPHPNVFSSSIAFGALELFCKSVERQHPFVPELVHTVGSALFTNWRELRRAQLHPMGHSSDGATTASFLRYMQQGQFCFQQLRDHEEQLASWRRAAQAAKRESQRLSEQLQKQHVARLFDRVQARVKAAADSAAAAAAREPSPNDDHQPYPQLRRILFGDQRGARLDLQPEDYEFEPTCEELLLVFNSLRPGEAEKLLAAMQTKACELQMPKLAEMYATAVDMLPEGERRRFLSEYFQLVASEELQEALQARDETNQQKQWETFLDEMKDVLHLDDPPRDPACHRAQQFHSDEARVGASVYELVDLVEELAAEVSLADDKKPLKLSADLVARLKPYQSVKKKMEKAKQLMMTVPQDVPPLTESTACGCVCGKHRLVGLDEPELITVNSNNATINPEILVLDRRRGDLGEEDSMRRKKSSQKRSSSATGKSTVKRKNSVNAVSARVSTRNSMATVRLFPLSEVCHLVSSVVQMQFARETGDASSSRRGSLRRNSRKATDQQIATQKPSFKSLAKDLLTRKYGIKSIAVLHMLQLEKSLVHFGATDKHTRCELFAWFIGADKTRSHYKDLAFQFYLRILKSVIALLLKKPLEDVSYADLIAVWTEQIGDADTSSGAVQPKSLLGAQCIEVCNSVFPVWMKESSAFTTLIERLKTTTESVDLELFFKRALVAWEAQLIKTHAQIEETFVRELRADVEELDFAVFSKCVAACGLELTTGQLLEYYDSLMGEDEYGVAVNKAVLFVIEQKHQ